jgi:hypothetical protein
VPVTGAASSSSSTALILQVMTQAVVMTLGDLAVQHIPDSQQQQQQQGALVLGSSNRSSSNVSSSADALALLQQLSLQACSGQQPSNPAHADQSANGSSNSLAAPPPVTQQQQQPGPYGAPGNFTVHQDEAWLAASSSKVQALLAMTLPRLLTHPQPAVRKALTMCAAQLLSGVTRALSSSRQAMLEILLTLANDDYEQVSQVAIAALQGQSAGNSSDAATATPNSSNLADSLAAAMTGAVPLDLSGQSTASTNSSSSNANTFGVVGGELLLQLCVEVPAAVRRGEASGTAAAKRAAAAVLCTGKSGACTQ